MDGVLAVQEDKRKSRVLVAAFEYHPRGGAEARGAVQLVDELRRRGRRSLVMIPRIPGSHDRSGTLTLGRLPMRYGNYLSIRNYIEFMVVAASVGKRLARWFSVGHQVSPMTFRLPSPLAELDIPFVWGPLGGSLPYPPGFETYARGFDPVHLLRRLDRTRMYLDPLLRRSLARASILVVNTTQAANLVPDAYRHKVRVIPDGFVYADRGGIEICEEPYIFSSGRLIRYKAFDLLIRAFAAASSRLDRGITLQITGTGEQRGSLEALINSLGLGARVRLLGPVEREDNIRLMQRSLMCVFPSLREAFGQVNLEAMAMGKPVVATAWGGPADIITDEETGLTVLGRNPAEHVELLADAMVRLARDEALRRRLGNAACGRVASHYSWAKLAGQYDALYDEIGR